MSKFRNVAAGLALALPLVLASCGTEAPEKANGVDLEHRYGFVSLVDGTMGVVDLETMSVVNKVHESTLASHMLYKLEGRNEVLYGDWDTNDILRIRFSEDYRDYEVAERINSPVQMHGFMTLPPDHRYIVVTSRVELKDKVLFEITQPDDSVAIYDTENGEWSEVFTGSPTYSALGPDGRLYVTNAHHKTVSAIDLERLEVVDTVRVGPEQWVTGENSIGPKSVTFSPDGRSMLTADYEGMSLTVVGLGENGLTNTRVVELDGVPKAATYTADGKEIWAVTFDLKDSKENLKAGATLESMGDWYFGPDPSDEVQNAYRDTTMHILNAETLEPLGSFSSDKAMISPRMSPDDENVVYVTTSAGSVLAIDRVTHTLIGEATVGRIGVPVICGNLTL